MMLGACIALIVALGVQTYRLAGATAELTNANRANEHLIGAMLVTAGVLPPEYDTPPAPDREAIEAWLDQ